ncbi:preprotein translocase, SecG subunit [[Eubacterium] yurii subsp. margaretiae ATCC 43715]|nr:preprotein translocase, SecG subunit [[Eubacterium] yurii subsp. margaretiae ATCC 43715]
MLEVSFLKTGLIILEMIVSIALIFSIMLQSGRDAGFSGAVSGMNDNLSGNKAKGLDEFYKKITSVTAILFILLSIALVAIH